MSSVEGLSARGKTRAVGKREESTRVGFVYDGKWVWLKRRRGDEVLGGVHYLDKVSDREYLDHWGKWLIFGQPARLRCLAIQLSKYVHCGLLDALKFNTEPSVRSRGSDCVMCVYCDDRDRNMVWFLLSGLGIVRPIWKYDSKTMSEMSAR